MSGCPYSKIKNTIPFFKDKNSEIEEEVLTTLDTERAIKGQNIEITDCPEKKRNQNHEKEQKEKKCPYSSQKNIITNDDSDVEDNIQKGGCPVMNTSNFIFLLVF